MSRTSNIFGGTEDEAKVLKIESHSLYFHRCGHFSMKLLNLSGREKCTSAPDRLTSRAMLENVKCQVTPQRAGAKTHGQLGAPGQAQRSGQPQ